MPRIFAIQLFREVANRGSFSEAARRLDLPPSSVSRQIDALEMELGVRLFHRTTRQLSLTDVGRHYLGRVTGVLDEMTLIHDELSEFGSTPTGLLRVTAPTEFMRVELAPRLPRFAARHPGVQIDLIIRDEYIDLVKEGIDVALRFGRLSDTSMIARRIAADPATICAAPQYLERHGTPEFPFDLTQHNCLLFKPPGSAEGRRTPEATWHFSKNEEDFDVQVRGNLIASSVAPLISAALNGMGITLAPQWSVDALIRDNRLETILDTYDVGWSGDERSIFLAYPSSRQLPLKVRAFADFLIEDFRRVPVGGQPRSAR